MADNMEEMVDKVSRFFLQTLPASRSKGPFSPRVLGSMFAEAQFCQDVSSKAKQYKKVVDSLEAKWPLFQASKVLFLGLCDNPRVNSASLDIARQLFDGSSTADLDTLLCTQQRNHLRDVFMAASQAIKPGPGWSLLKSYMLLIRMDPSQQDAEDRKLAKLLEEKPHMLLEALLIKEEKVEWSQDRIMRLLSKRLNLAKLIKCEISLLGRVCEENEAALDIILKALVTALIEDPSFEKVEQVGSVVVGLVTSGGCCNPLPILQKLDTSLPPSFARAELLNWLTAKLACNGVS